MGPITWINYISELVLQKIYPFSIIFNFLTPIFFLFVCWGSLFSFLASDIFVVHQNESTQYVCELCQKQGKVVRSTQLIENGESKTSLPGVEFQNFSSDTTMCLPQVPRGDGKVCDPYCSIHLAFTCVLSNFKLTNG